jgi:peptide/nickel transport system permease protein
MTIPVKERGLVHYYLRSTSGIVGAVLLFLMIAVSLASLFKFTPHDPLYQDIENLLKPPSSTFWFGTDNFGRDVFSRTIDGMRRSLTVSITAVAIATFVGVLLGVVAGFVGGWFDQFIARVSDVLFSFPAILLALAIVSSLGNDWYDTAFAIAIVYTPIFVRVARGPVLTVKEMDYIKASRILGYSTPRIIWKHVFPNITAPVIVQIALSLSWAILTESGLSFLGLGTQPPNASLGLMVAEAQPIAAFAWWNLAFPSIFITIVVVGLNLVGDGLRDALDPARRSS